MYRFLRISVIALACASLMFSQEAQSQDELDAALAVQNASDPNARIAAAQTLAINPSNVGVLLELAYAIPSRTREFDLDKAEKLSKAEGYATKALALVPNLTKLDPNMPDDQWLNIKKDYMSRGNEALGVIESKRENYDAAVSLLQKAIDVAPQGMAMTYYHLADAQLGAGKKAEAIAAINQSITLGGVPLGGGGDAAKDLKAKIEAAN